MSAKLLELMGTQYLGVHHREPLFKILSEHHDVDISNCRISLDAMDLINEKLAAGWNIYDSSDKEREFILAQARERAMLTDVKERETLPELIDVKNINSYIYDTLKSNVNYDIDIIKKFDKQYIVPLLILINVFRPDVKIYTKRYFPDMGYLISTYIYRKGAQAILRTTNEFTLIGVDYSRDVLFETNDINEPVFVPGYGEVTFEYLRYQEILIPAYFGKKLIVEDALLFVSWTDLVSECLKRLETYFLRKKTTIKSFLTGGTL